MLDADLSARQPFLDFVYSRTNPEGSRQYLMVSGEPMFDPAGRFTGYRGIGKDVTDTMLPDHESASEALDPLSQGYATPRKAISTKVI